jgi:hypothetical protein
VNQRPPWLPYAVFVTAGVALYARAFAVQRYGDDLGFVLPTPIDPLFHFAAPHPNHDWYRPVEAMLLALVQNGCGLAVWPIHALAVTLHLALALLVRAIARDLGLRDAAAWLAAVWCLTAQVAVMAVTSSDTLSQQLAALGVTAAAWQFHRALRDGDGRGLAIGWLAAALALWGKESGLAVVPVSCLVAAPWIGQRAARRRAATAVAGVGLLAAVYWLCRARVVAELPQLGTQDYGFAVGLNIPLNVANLWGAVLTPLSTVDLVRWMQLGPAWAFGLATLPAAGLLVWTAYAWGDRRRLLIELLLLAAAALLPTALLHHVSELYAYQALPWLSILAGGALAELLPRWREAVVAGLLVMQVVTVQGKLTQMRANGERTASYLAQLAAVVEELPPGGQVYLVEGPGEPWRYGVFVLPGFRVFDHSVGGLPTILGRPDLRFALRGHGDMPDLQPGEVAVTLAVDAQTVVRLAPAEANLDS